MPKIEDFKGIISSKFDEIVEKNEFDIFFNTNRVKQCDIEYHELIMGKNKAKNIYINRDFNNPELNKKLEETLSPEQLEYRNNGCVIKRSFIPEELINKYTELRKRLGLGNEQLSVNEYVNYKEARDILNYRPLTELIRELHSAEMGLVFMLTKYISTERSWHQDAYLDHDDSLARVAVWIALDDIHEDSGPFEYINGSHKWHPMSNQSINKFMNEEYQWPQGQRNLPEGKLPWGRASELFVGPAVEKKMKREGITPQKFIAKKGDVLIWYGRLMHRGSVPKNKNLQRPSIIGHYAPIFEKDRGLFLRDDNGSFYLVPKS